MILEDMLRKPTGESEESAQGQEEEGEDEEASESEP
jgi:hypothetical protein